MFLMFMIPFFGVSQVVNDGYDDADATKYYDGDWKDLESLQAKFDGLLGSVEDDEENGEDEYEDDAPWENEDETWPRDNDEDAAAWTGRVSIYADQDEAAWTGTGSGAEQDEAAWGGTGDDESASWMGAAGEDAGHSWIKEDEDEHGTKDEAQNRQL